MGIYRSKSANVKKLLPAAGSFWWHGQTPPCQITRNLCFDQINFSAWMLPGMFVNGQHLRQLSLLWTAMINGIGQLSEQDRLLQADFSLFTLIVFEQSLPIIINSLFPTEMLLQQYIWHTTISFRRLIIASSRMHVFTKPCQQDMWWIHVWTPMRFVAIRSKPEAII